MTSTTDATFTVARGDLVLATVSEEFTDWPGTAPEDRTFYVTVSEFSDDYVTLVVSESDPRHAGMWAGTWEFCHGLELEGQHYGWNVLRRFIRPADETTTETTTTTDEDRPFVVGDRVRISADHPAGSPWAGATGTVQREGYHTSVLLDSGHSGGFRAEYLTHVDTIPTPEGEGRTYSREDVDRMLAEERQRALEALEEFKRAANERAVEYAESNGLCSEFERCMSDIGLLGRDEWHEQNDDTYRVEFIVSVEVTARDEEDATYKARSELYEDLSYPIDQTIVHHSTGVL